MKNRIELLLEAVISKDSQVNIERQVTQLQNKLNALTIDKSFLESLEKLNKFSADGASTKKLQEELKKAQDELGKVKKKADEVQDAVGNVKFKIDGKSVVKDLNDLQRMVESKGGALKYELDMSSGHAEVTKMSATFDKFGEKVTEVFKKVQVGNDIVWDVGVIKKYESTVRDTAKSYDQLLKQIGELGRQGKLTNEQMSGLTRDLEKAKDSKVEIDALSTSIKTLGESNTYVDLLTRKLEKLEAQGKITQGQFQDLSKYISSSGTVNTKRYDELMQKMGMAVIATNKYKSSLKSEKVETDKLVQAQHKLADAHSAVTAARNKMPRIARHEDYNQLINDLNQVNNLFRKGALSSVDLERNLTGINSRLKSMTAEAVQMQRTQIGITESFKIAMEKFPVWMAATTLFYGAIRTSKEFMSIIVDIDTKMTELRKVMSDGTDFGAVFRDGTESAREFGQTLSKTMDAYIEFARQGFEGNQLKDLADAALVFSNVSELSTSDAAGHLTATIVQYNKEASEAMRITDDWNEIGNNFATTSSAVAEGVNKSASVAKAMGMELEELNGMVAQLTASTKQSGAEIGNMIKSVLPRLTSKPAKAALDSLDVALTDTQGNLRNVIEIYRDVGVAIQDMDGLQKASIAEGLGG